MHFLEFIVDVMVSIADIISNHPNKIVSRFSILLMFLAMTILCAGFIYFLLRQEINGQILLGCAGFVTLIFIGVDLYRQGKEPTDENN